MRQRRLRYHVKKRQQEIRQVTYSRDFLPFLFVELYWALLNLTKSAVHQELQLKQPSDSRNFKRTSVTSVTCDDIPIPCLRIITACFGRYRQGTSPNLGAVSCVIDTGVSQFTIDDLAVDHWTSYRGRFNYNTCTVKKRFRKGFVKGFIHGVYFHSKSMVFSQTFSKG